MVEGQTKGARSVLLLGFGLGILIIGILLSVAGHERTLGLWNIRTYGWTFLDIRLIPGGAASYAQGYDPAIWNPGDPLQRQFNYPKVWYLLFRLPMTQAWAMPMALASIALFLAAVWVFPGRLTYLSAGLLLLALFSPAGMLAMSRANTDILVFAAMALSLVLVQEHAMAALLVLLGAIVFKIIPVLGAGLFLRADEKSGLQHVLVAILFTGLYFLLTLNDMVFIFRHTQKGYQEAYGLAVLPGLLQNLAHDPTVHAGPAVFKSMVTSVDGLLMSLPFLPYAVACASLVLFTYLGSRHRASMQGGMLRNLRALWMGAGMYIGTFLIGNNWDYRLVFLVFAIPQLVEWGVRGTRTTRVASILTLVLLFGSLWAFVIRAWMAAVFELGAAYANVMDEAANWALYGALIFLLTSSLPSRVFEEIDSGLRSLRPSRSITKP